MNECIWNCYSQFTIFGENLVWEFGWNSKHPDFYAFNWRSVIKYENPPWIVWNKSNFKILAPFPNEAWYIQDIYAFEWISCALNISIASYECWMLSWIWHKNQQHSLYIDWKFVPLDSLAKCFVVFIKLMRHHFTEFAIKKDDCKSPKHQTYRHDHLWRFQISSWLQMYVVRKEIKKIITEFQMEGKLQMRSY